MGLPNLPPIRIQGLSLLARLESLSAVQSFLRLLSKAYRWGAGVRNLAYSHQWLPTVSAPVPVISVGGLEAGGTGKTPITCVLAELLMEHRPLVILRGYGGRKGGGVPYMVRGDEPVAEVGEEALLHKRWHPDAAVVISGDRAQAAQRFGELAGTILLDDGFQHRKLHRNLNILVAPAAPPSSLLPQGRLREPVEEALGRADLLWIHDSETASIPEWWKPHYSGPVIRSTFVLKSFMPLAYRRGALAGPEGNAMWLSNESHIVKVENDIVTIKYMKNIKVFSVCCIARGVRFRAALHACGLSVVHELCLPDHFRLSERELCWVEAEALRMGAEGIVVTEKDSVHLHSIARHWVLPWWVAVGVVEIQDITPLKEQFNYLFNS